MAMTCCADDTTFLGYVCKSPYAPKLKPGDWVKVRAKVGFANVSVYRGEGPVLEAEYIEEAQPIEELVYSDMQNAAGGGRGPGAHSDKCLPDRAGGYGRRTRIWKRIMM